MNFNIIELEKWERRECFEHFMTIAKSTYNLTVNVDISILMEFIKKNNYRLYPTFTWIVSRAINKHLEFKMGYDKEKNLGYYDVVHPDYSVLNEKTKIMDTLCTEYNNEFSTFYKMMVNDLDNYKKFGMKTDRKRDSFIVSCIPWLTYSSFNVSNESGYQFLFPMVTWGKYFKVGDKTLMPVTLQIHHAAADGYHCYLFYEELEQVLKNPKEYLNQNKKS